MIYRDRYDAGRRLAAKLEPYRGEHPIVLGLPRGGVIVAYEVASALEAPLDVLVVRKVGAPGAEEFAIGAIAADVTLVNQPLVAQLGISRGYIAAAVERERSELLRRERLYRGDRPPVELGGRTVIVVDDGLATGATALAALQVLRRRQPGRLVMAAPVCSPDAAAMLRTVADDVVCLECPADFRAVGLWYTDFTATSDAEVIDCLRAANQRRVPA
ncbi:MAG TPA: phosphoribosyltransferase family protein [Gemmatimonadales bacterium]|nr:phosphoribosyltransferase family protein [Gemmatimonadales bacterium]